MPLMSLMSRVVFTGRWGEGRHDVHVVTIVTGIGDFTCITDAIDVTIEMRGSHGSDAKHCGRVVTDVTDSTDATDVTDATHVANGIHGSRWSEAR